MKDRFIQMVTVLREALLRERGEGCGMDGDEENKDQEIEAVKNELLDGHFMVGKWKEYAGYPVGKAYRDFVRRVGRKKNRMPWITIGSAAAVILLFIGIREGMHQKKTEDIVPAVAVVDRNELIEPGKTKAVLRLTDGRKVDIGGERMQIREKSGTEIEYADGKIAYQTTAAVKTLEYNELDVPLAGECYITLDDGTKVWMNAGSKLKYPVRFVGEDRKVFLAGEAYFEVKKAQKPFIVSTALGDIRVLGTSFNVKAYQEEEEMYTTLVEGKVCFEGGEKVEIIPGEQVVATSGGKVSKRKVNIDEYVGWKDGIYVFRDHPLEAIMTDLARWYDVSVFYQNPEMKQITFTGNLKRYERINTFMDVLKRTGDVKYSIQGNTIILFE